MNEVRGSKKCLIVLIKITLTSVCPASQKVLAIAIQRLMMFIYNSMNYVIYKPTCSANYDYRMASTRLPELQTMSKHEAAQIAVHYDYQIP